MRLCTCRGAPINAHRPGKICRTNPAAVDPIHAENFLGMLDRFDRFNLNCQEKLVVDPLVVIAAKVEGQCPTARAPATRRIARSESRRPGFLGRIHHRHHEPQRSAVEQLTDRAEVVPPDAHHRNRRAKADVAEGNGRRFVSPNPMLVIDQNEIESRTRQHLRGQRCTEPAGSANGRLAPEHFLLGGIGGRRCKGVHQAWLRVRIALITKNLSAVIRLAPVQR